MPDLLAEQLNLVFCGTAPSEASKQAQAYYAHPGNIFWKSLYEAGLTATILHHKNYAELLNIGVGLTDLNKTESGADSALSEAEFNIEAFKQKMLHYRPRMVGFTSKFAAGKYFKSKAIRYGLQTESLEQISFFVLPSTSGRARRYFDITYWKTLAQIAQLHN